MTALVLAFLGTQARRQLPQHLPSLVLAQLRSGFALLFQDQFDAALRSQLEGRGRSITCLAMCDYLTLEDLF